MTVSRCQMEGRSLIIIRCEHVSSRYVDFLELLQISVICCGKNDLTNQASSFKLLLLEIQLRVVHSLCHEEVIALNALN